MREGAPHWSWDGGEETMPELVEEPKVVATHSTDPSTAASTGADAPPERMIVVARGKEDISYLSIYLPDIPHTVYQVGASPIPQTNAFGHMQALTSFSEAAAQQHSACKRFPDQGGWRPENALLDRGYEPHFKAAPQAKETNVYLQYIVDHYEKLPKSIAFIHAHR